MVDHALHVRCDNDRCPDPADTVVRLQPIAPGVLARPGMVCAGCGYEVMIVSYLIGGKLRDDDSAE